ncbi:exo-beta-N-acetylmuramidase NamZ family protein [Chitinophaga lutea]
MKRILCLFVCLMAIAAANAAPPKDTILTGADQTALYLPLLKGKRVGMLVNPTSIIGRTPIVDSLKKRGVNITVIFGPEHGFRANAQAGEHVKDEIDPVTKIPVVSLYGRKRKPSKEDMAKIDVMIYDVQDVGCRFYTNINTMRDIMEVCAETGKPMIILDRPNPNAFIDGPILDMKYQTGIGRFPVPVTHGMTVGEFAKMVQGEGWMEHKDKLKLRVIPVKNYKHGMDYVLPIPPSPNLPTQQSVLLYPSTCLFEGIYLNHGRGTDWPFMVMGSPELKGIYSFSYTPRSIPGKAATPLFMGQECFGLDLREYDISEYRKKGKINIQWVMELYKAHPHKEKFFDSKLSNQMNTIESLIGVGEFRQQIIDGVSEADIRKTWAPGIAKYKVMRKKYQIYADLAQ